MSENLLESYFDFNIYLLKLAGLWLYDERTSWQKRWFQHAYNIFWATYLYFIYFPTEALYLSVAVTNLTFFIRCLRDMGNHVALIIKALNWYLQRRSILKLLIKLTHHNYHYEDYDKFKPEEIIAKHKKQAVKWTKILFNLINAICFCMFVSGIFIFAFFGKNSYELHDGHLIYVQKLPVYVISPFGTSTRLKFLITFLYIVVALTFYGWMISALDSLFTTIMSCISAQVLIIQGAILSYKPRVVLRVQKYHKNSINYPEELEKEMMYEFRQITKHLQLLFDVSEKLEDIYYIQTFFQTLISLGEICFCLYLLSQTLDENTGNELIYLFSTSFQFLLYCWFGNMLTEASKGVQYAIYDSDWLSVSFAVRKQMVLTMTRLQKPIYITIGKITPLTFTTFLTVARGAYSFFTFLKQKQSGKPRF